MLNSESGHWYDQNGFSCYTQITKSGPNKGKSRNTTLRDARKLGLVPSVTGIIKVMAKPQLNRWINEQLVLLAVEMPRILGEPSPGFIMRVNNEFKKQGEERMALGTAIHDGLERGFKGSALALDDKFYYDKVIECLNEHCPDETWSAERSFASQLGYGGKVDLSSPNWIIDFKTKEFTPEAKVKSFIYNDHRMQAQAYGHGLCLEEFRCGNIFISTHPEHKGLVKFVEHEPDDNRAWKTFFHLLKVWQFDKDFDSSWMIADEAC